jgi:hypothetical protein
VVRSARVLAQLATPEFEDDGQVSGETSALAQAAFVVGGCWLLAGRCRRHGRHARQTCQKAGLIFGAVMVCVREQLMEQVKQITEVMAYTVQYATRRRRCDAAVLAARLPCPASLQSQP